MRSSRIVLIGRLALAAVSMGAVLGMLPTRVAIAQTANVTKPTGLNSIPPCPDIQVGRCSLNIRLELPVGCGSFTQNSRFCVGSDAEANEGFGGDLPDLPLEPQRHGTDRHLPKQLV